MTSHRPVVLVTSRSFGTGTVDTVARLEEHGVQVRRHDRRHDLDDLGDILPEVDAWIAGTSTVGADHFDVADRLRLVARYGVGVEAVDLDAATDRGVVVTNTPGANTVAVAEHTVGLILAALRHTVEADHAVRNGGWSMHPGRELSGATVGLVGYGAVGRSVARLVAAFGAEVLAHDPYLDRADVPLLRLDEVCTRSDVVSLHAAGDDLVLDASTIDLLPQHAIVVNTARAGLVDEIALADALGHDRIAAVASDVTEDVDSPLRTAPRTIHTPHLAAQTVQAIDRMGLGAVDECLRMLVRDEPPAHPVNPTTKEPQ